MCLLQDDDVLPEDSGWVDEAIALFDADATLVIVSGYYGVSRQIYGTIRPENRYPSVLVTGNTIAIHVHRRGLRRTVLHQEVVLPIRRRLR